MCPGCGAPQLPLMQANGPIWLAVASLCLGLLSFILVFAGDTLDKDQVRGTLLFCAASIVLAIISLNRQNSGKKIAIAGICISAIAILGAMGQ